MSRSSDLLSPTGPFARLLSGYEARDGQREVAAAVERTFDTDGILLCEAGTGIGKTFAYLVPAILSGRKVVISTATRALQDQIASRDLPLVQQALGTSVEVAVMKGLSNYVCRRRKEEFILSPEALRPGHASDLEALRYFLKESETGDLAELGSVREDSVVRQQVASSSDTRIGSSCQYYNDCYVTQMKREADLAQIVVVNHHLFFADLALRGPHPGRVLPDYDAVVLDEAHQMEDTAALFFGSRVTSTGFDRLLKEVDRAAVRAATSRGGADARSFSSLSAAAGNALKALFTALNERRGPGRRVLGPDDLEGSARQAYITADARLREMRASLRSRADEVDDDQSLRDALGQAARRTQSLRESLEAIISPQEGHVAWSEVSGGRMALSSTPVDLSEVLKTRLFEDVPAVALMSATLSTTARPSAKGFDYVRSRLGLSEDPRVTELSVASPFDYEKHCVLYLPRDLPPAGTEAFWTKAGERISELVEISDGGAFVLTTSLVAMRRLHDELKERLPKRQIWLQGERPKEMLLSAFRAHGSGVLVATSSFWEGVDVPGHALRLVVMEKLPFLVPTDPVVMARSEALERAGKSAFAHLALPSAAITLKQGFGRLIRRQDDVGVVALLDERAVKKGYGKKLLSALPPARRVEQLDDVRAAVAEFRAEAPDRWPAPRGL